ncbi:inositol-trisphosphate 3-kinase homolog [Tachypleus tridentatus]|uniref:inositol-trisphosphate 3-kinase homolog n=1 Tax=Tachypleus tridentatus TaxID=6853 RepID=UPI003FCF77F9
MLQLMGDAKAVELTKILQHKQENFNKNKKDLKRRWKEITRSALCGSEQKELTEATTSIDLSSNRSNGDRNVDMQQLTLLQLLALNSLELTAPASDILLKNWNNNWIQLSGHEGLFAPAGPGTIWKKRSPEDDTEVQAYRMLMTDSMREMVPRFYRDVEYEGENFIEMEDLLYNFRDPAIMDIKMGTRTFLEIEVQNNKARKDLYEKMIRIDPNSPSLEEHKIGAVTKLRYMQFREALSSSSNLGFRIEGFKAEGKAPMKNLKSVKTEEEVKNIFSMFFGDNLELYEMIIERLKLLRSKFEKSPFFQTHEVIGSSLLIIHDGRKTNAWMIDFAKTKPIPRGLSINHLNKWVLGNHEDGYLFGLNNLISILETIAASMCSST